MSKIHHYEVLTQYGKTPIASFLEWNDAVNFSGCYTARLYCIKHGVPSGLVTLARVLANAERTL